MTSTVQIKSHSASLQQDVVQQWESASPGLHSCALKTGLAPPDDNMIRWNRSQGLSREKRIGKCSEVERILNSRWGNWAGPSEWMLHLDLPCVSRLPLNTTNHLTSLRRAFVPEKMQSVLAAVCFWCLTLRLSTQTNLMGTRDDFTICKHTQCHLDQDSVSFSWFVFNRLTFWMFGVFFVFKVQALDIFFLMLELIKFYSGLFSLFWCWTWYFLTSLNALIISSFFYSVKNVFFHLVGIIYTVCTYIYKLGHRK